ncbi:MAG: hypothetical protein HRF45_09980 [Fimbriimonadia bacterium]|jgi:hypothetical protein
MRRGFFGLVAVILCSSVPAQEYNLRRLFRADELCTYAMSVEASLSIRSGELRFDKAEYTATARLKTAGIREGIATQYLSFQGEPAVVAAPKIGLAAARLPELIVGAKVQNAGVVSWEATAGTFKGPLPWHAQCFVPSEWAPPMPSRLLPIAASYNAELVFALAAYLPEPGWPTEVRVPAEITFLGSTGPRDAMLFRLSREGQLALNIASADSKGEAKGSLKALGNWSLDAATGRLVECDLTWLIRIEVSAPADLGGPRAIDAMVHLEGKLIEVGSVRDR